MYGEDYEIVEKHRCLDDSFFGLIHKECLMVKYRVKNQDKFMSKPEVPVKPVVSKIEAQNFEKNKTDIIRNTIGTNLDKKISGQTEKLDIILNALDEIKSKSGEKHNKKNSRAFRKQRFYKFLHSDDYRKNRKNFFIEAT